MKKERKKRKIKGKINDREELVWEFVVRAVESCVGRLVGA